MSSSTGSGRVVGEGAGWSAESVVETDRGGEGEEARSDSGCEAVEGAGAVAFESEQVFAGLEDRLDPLRDRCEVGAAAAFVSATARDSGGELFDLAAGVAFVADHEQVPGVTAALQQGEADIALSVFGEVSISASGVPSMANRPCRRKPSP
jgi:hypothetical protein